MTDDIANEVNAMLRELAERANTPLKQDEITVKMLMETQGITYYQADSILKSAEATGEMTSRTAYDPITKRSIKAYRKAQK